MQSTNGSDRDLALMASARREAEGLAQADRLGVLEPGGPDERAQAEAPDGYRLVRALRRGAQGDVYEGGQEATGRRVAIKFLRDRAKSGAERARLEREARLLARMNHPNLVQVLDCGETPTGRFFAVMEYIEGSPIDEYVRDLALSPLDTARLFIGVAEAVAAAHLRGVLHRDLKPAHVLVDPAGRPHVLDFGLAKMVRGASELDSTETCTPGFFGTLAWASPEQIRGEPDDVDLRTDVYSLGVVLYQLLTGRLPHGTDAPFGVSAEAILKAAPPAPRSIRRAIPRDLETVVLKCLNKERERRYGSAGELASDLRRAVAGQPIDARRDSTLYLIRSVARRHKVPAAVGALLLAVGLASGAMMGLLFARSQERLQGARQENQELRDELARLRANLVRPPNWTYAFLSAEAIKKLAPEEGWALVQGAWAEMTEDHPKQQLLKMASIAQPPYYLRVLNLGASDPSPAVQRWSFLYLKDVAFQDFAEDFAAYKAWYERYSDKPLPEVRRENLLRLVEEIRKAPPAEFEPKLELLGRSSVFRAQPELLAVAREAGLIDLLIKVLGEPGSTDAAREAATGALSQAPLDEPTLRERILPLLSDQQPGRVRTAAVPVLGAGRATFAVPPLLDALTLALAQPDASRIVDLFAVGQALGAIGDARAIPTMIAAIEADNTYDTIYGVGYFGLWKITGVEYQESHDGEWWRRWWENNKERFPVDVRNRQIPKLPARGARTGRPAPTGEPGARDLAGTPPVQQLFAGGDPRKFYYLIGPHDIDQTPERGWRLLLVLPGGDGSAEFLPFVTEIFAGALPQGYLLAQLVAPQWSKEQLEQVVWPTRGLPWAGAKFATEEFVQAVVTDIDARYSVDTRHIYTLGWSSGGPPVYAAALAPGSPITGAFVAMSIFKPEQLSDLKNASGKAFYILHSPTDFIPMSFPEAARDQLAGAGAKTTLAEYEGGHGWHGNVFANIRRGIEWLQEQVGR